MQMTVEQRKLHFDLTHVGLRAQATAAGLVQLCKELERAGVIDGQAIDRVKSAIADDIAVTAPRSVRPDVYRQDVMRRLDSIFSGEKKLGSAEGFAFDSEAGS